MEKIKSIAPGVVLSILIMLFSLLLADWIAITIGASSDEGTSPVSPIFLAIILGIIISNTFGTRELFEAGITFSLKFILKLGIIFLGIRLSFIDVIVLGAWGIPIIVGCVITGIVVTTYITRKLNQPHKLGILTAVGTGICGITAIVSTAPAIKANKEQVAYAVANITIFGVIGMFFYPYLAHFLFSDDPVRAGLFLGTSIHDTAQVAGAALIYDQVFVSSDVVDIATISKLTRNTLLVAVVPLMSYYYFKTTKAEKNLERKKWYQLFPLFVLGFLMMAIVRTVGDSTAETYNLAFGILNPVTWTTIWESINIIGSKYLLGTAMAAVGLSTNLKIFKTIGLKPFYIGLFAAFSVTIVSLIMVALLGGFITY